MTLFDRFVGLFSMSDDDYVFDFRSAPRGGMAVK